MNQHFFSLLFCVSNDNERKVLTEAVCVGPQKSICDHGWCESDDSFENMAPLTGEVSWILAIKLNLACDVAFRTPGDSGGGNGQWMSSF